MTSTRKHWIISTGLTGLQGSFWKKIIQQITHCAASAITSGTLALLMVEYLFPSFVHYLFQVIKFVTSFGCTLMNRACGVSLKLYTKYQACSVCITQPCLAETSLLRLGGKAPKRFNLPIHMTDQGYFIKGKNITNLEITDKQNNSLRSV